MLDYCWETIYTRININSYQNVAAEKQTEYLFDCLYFFMAGEKNQIKRTVKNNSIDGQMADSMKKYIKNKIKEMILNCPEADKYPLPFDMIAEHYANTIWTVLEWSFLCKNPLSKENAKLAVRYLLGTLEERKETL